MKRKRRIGSSILSDPFKFEPDAVTWERLEQAYGTLISLSAREEFAKVVNDYLLNAQFEKNAPFANDVTRHVNKFRKAAKIFCHALNEVAGGPGSDSEARFAAKKLIFLNHLCSTIDFDDYLMKTTLVVSASDIVHKGTTLKNRTSFTEGDAWIDFCLKSRGWARTHHLPFGVRKDDQKRRTDGQASPFAMFMFALQKEFPSDLQRHIHSPGAMATAIHAVRKR